MVSAQTTGLNTDTLFIHKDVKQAKEKTVYLTASNTVLIKVLGEKRFRGQMTSHSDSSIVILNRGITSVILFKDITYIKILSGPIQRKVGRSLSLIALPIFYANGILNVASFIRNPGEYLWNGIIGAAIAVGATTALLHEAGKLVHGKKIYMDNQHRIFHAHWTM